MIDLTLLNDVDCAIPPGMTTKLDEHANPRQRVVKLMVSLMGVGLVLDRDANRSVISLYFQPIRPGVVNRYNVAERQSVGEEGDAAQLEPLHVVGPRPHLLVVPRKPVSGEIEPHNVVRPVAGGACSGKIV